MSQRRASDLSAATGQSFASRERGRLARGGRLSTNTHETEPVQVGRGFDERLELVGLARDLETPRARAGLLDVTRRAPSKTVCTRPPAGALRQPAVLEEDDWYERGGKSYPWVAPKYR
jgi:hypothetical protein